jgi:hypothetical protein
MGKKKELKLHIEELNDEIRELKKDLEESKSELHETQRAVYEEDHKAIYLIKFRYKHLLDLEKMWWSGDTLDKIKAGDGIFPQMIPANPPTDKEPNSKDMEEAHADMSKTVKNPSSGIDVTETNDGWVATPKYREAVQLSQLEKQEAVNKAWRTEYDQLEKKHEEAKEDIGIMEERENVYVEQLSKRKEEIERLKEKENNFIKERIADANEFDKLKEENQKLREGIEYIQTKTKDLGISIHCNSLLETTDKL